MLLCRKTADKLSRVFFEGSTAADFRKSENSLLRGFSLRRREIRRYVAAPHARIRPALAFYV